MDFGRRLTKIREEAGYTQSTLAEAAGLAQSEISQLESGVRSPTYKTICKIAKGMRVPPAHLMGGASLGLSASERGLLRRYRSLSESGRRECERLVQELYARQLAAEKAMRSGEKEVRIAPETDRGARRISTARSPRLGSHGHP